MMHKRTLFLLFTSIMIIMNLFGWAARSQVEIAEMAGMLLTDDAFPISAAFYVAYEDEILSGTVFPDWAYQNFWTSNSLSDHAHQMTFGDLYLDYVISTFDLSDPSNHPELAFCLGLLSHIYADRLFYGDNGEYGLGEAGTFYDGIGMGDLETNLDRIVGHDYEPPDFDWYWPIETIIEVYDLYGDDVGTAGLWAGLEAMELLYDGRAAIDSFAYLNAVDAIPWTNDNFGNYYPGGLMNCAALSALKFRNAWAMAIEDWQILQQAQIGCGYMGTEDVHFLPHSPTSNTGGENRLIASWDPSDGNGGTLLKWDVSDIDTTGFFIETAKIYLYYKRPHTSIPSGNKTLALYKLNKDWTEGDFEDGENSEYDGETQSPGDNLACFSHARYNSIAWDSPCADGVPGDRDEFHLSYNDFGPAVSYPYWYSWDVTSALRAWLLNPTTNFGMILKEEENSYSGMVEFIASESQLINYHPLLIVRLTDVTTSIAEKPEEVKSVSTLSAYPNPFIEHIDITSKSSGDLSIYSIDGRIVHEIESRYSTLSQNCFRWHPSKTTEPGIYLIKNHQNSETIRVVYMEK